MDESLLDKKLELVAAINAFQVRKEVQGNVNIDFGVKGGELDKDTRAPSIVDFYSVSPELGKDADRVLAAIESLALEVEQNPPDATKFLGTAEGAQCPLHGAWINRFTNAADATFSKNSKRGDADVYNVVDGVSGTIWNVIDFKSSSSPLKQLRVRLAAQAVSPQRVRFVFRYVKAHLKIKNRTFTLTVPVPAPFLTKILFFFRRNAKKPPPAYFDILYLDDDLRVQKTAQGAYFVQARPPWARVV